MILYVKKVWTWNPTGYKYIPIEKALKKYKEYTLNCIESKYVGPDEIKTFQNWLKTEI